MQRSPFRAVLRLKSVTNSKINLNWATFHFFQKGFDAKQPFKFLTLNNLTFKKICSGCSDHFGKKQRKLFTAEVGTAAKSLVPSSANRSLTVLQAYRKNFVKTKFTVRLQKQIKYCFTKKIVYIMIITLGRYNPQFEIFPETQVAFLLKKNFV